MEVFKLFAGAFVLIFVILFPTTSKEAVLEAIGAWAFSFVPALLPVFAVAPALTCEEARKVYARGLGKISLRLFGVSGDAFAPVAVALMAGSPAGAIALGGVKCDKGELCRAGIMASGLSPAFLSAGVGGLLGSPETGIKLALSQLMAILSSGWLLRAAWKDEKETVNFAPAPETLLGGMGKAALDMAGVLCWMALFGLIAAILKSAVPAAGAAAPLLEIAGGAAKLAGAPLPQAVKEALTAFFCGLGGVCVAFQNLSRLKDLPAKRLMLGKALHATLTALYFQTLSGTDWTPARIPIRGPWPFMIAVVAVWLAGRKMDN